MQQLKFYFFLLFFLFQSNIIDAQKVFIKTDIGLSSLRYRPAIAMGGRFGYGLGIETVLNLKSESNKFQYLTFNPSLSFVKTAYSIYVANAANSNIVANYMRLDLPLMQTLIADRPGHEFFLGAGPYLALPVGGHFTSQSTRYKMRYGNTSASNRRGNDVGLVFKLSATHFLNTDIRCSLQYNYGLNNLVPKYYNPNDIRIRSRNIYLSFAFPLN
jgi:hypothetical protein